MAEVRPIELGQTVLDITSDWRVSTRATRPGPPERVDGLTVGLVSMSSAAPHGGEVHPDGDEILIVVSGRMRVSCDNLADFELGPGEACIVPKGEWHRLYLIEPTQLVHITPGPHGDHRPVD